MRLFLFDVDGTLITARGAGRQALGQATGQHLAEELAGCGPDLLLPDLADVPRVVRALTGE